MDGVNLIWSSLGIAPKKNARVNKKAVKEFLYTCKLISMANSSQQKIPLTSSMCPKGNGAFFIYKMRSFKTMFILEFNVTFTGFCG